MGKKITPEKMLEEIADKLIIYLKYGQLETISFIEKLDFNISNFEQLIRLHFVLQDKVKEFVEKLPERIRNIKTSIKKYNKLFEGEVRGKIDWQKTLKHRFRTNPKNKRDYICQQAAKNYNIKENLILNRLLEVIFNIVFEELEIHDNNYPWLEPWFSSQKLSEQLEAIYKKNIYLKRIEFKNSIKITSRMIQDTLNSKNILYQEAASLLDYYKKIINLDNLFNHKEEVIKLFNDTFIRPERKEVLFELYWIIKLINSKVDDEKNDLCELGLLSRDNNNLVATWQKQGKLYSIYHDSLGSGYIDMKVSINEFDEIKESFFKRRIDGRNSAINLLENEFNNKNIGNYYWEGRPDIIIEVEDKDTNDLEKIIIGEIKYTRNFNTIKQGMYELLDYLKLLKINEEYINMKETDIEIAGILLFDEMERDKSIYGLNIYFDKNKNEFDSYPIYENNKIAL
ncbi:MAG: hypothetical protein ACOC2W_03925 [bacterium]